MRAFLFHPFSLALGFALAAMVTLWTTKTVWPHDAVPTAAKPLGWKYPYACCSDVDCRPASDAEVRETATGYLIVATGEVVPFGDPRIKDSPDGRYHVCQVGGDFEHGRRLCLFVPPRSF